MELGHYGWNKNINYYTSHSIFLTDSPPLTTNYGLFNLGDAPFDGISPAFFYGNNNGNYIAINTSSSFQGDFFNIGVGGLTSLQLSNSSGFINLRLTNVITGDWVYVAPNELDTHNSSTGAFSSILNDTFVLSTFTNTTTITSSSMILRDTVDQTAQIFDLVSSGFYIIGNVWSGSISGTYYSANTNPGTRISQDTSGTIRLQISELEPVFTEFTTWNDALVVNADKSVHTYGGLTVDGTLSLPSQTQHYVFAAPSGSSGTPTFRQLVANDNPDILAMMWMEAAI